MDDMPRAMRRYLKYFGWHFNKQSYEFAASLMWKESADGKKERVEPLLKEQVDELLKANNITLDTRGNWDYMYWAMQCKADLMPDAIEDAKHHALYVKRMTEDVDVTDEAAFRVWYIKTVGSGIGIPFDDFLDK